MHIDGGLMFPRRANLERGLMSAGRIVVVVSVITLHMPAFGPALARWHEGPAQELAADRISADVRVAQAKKAPDATVRNAEALYSQCRAAVVRTYGRASGSRDPNQDSLNAEIRMQEAASLDSKIDYCIQNGGRP